MHGLKAEGQIMASTWGASLQIRRFRNEVRVGSMGEAVIKAQGALLPKLNTL